MKIQSLGLLSMALIIGGCSTNDHLSDKGDNIPLGVSSASLCVLSTRASTPVTDEGSELRVFRLATNGYSAANTVFKYASASGWGYEDKNPVIYLNSAEAHVCAITPAISGMTAPDNLSLTAQAYSSLQDLCYSSLSTCTNTSPSTSFSDMQRAYSEITLSITKDDSYNGTGSITKTSILGDEIYNTAALNITSGSAVYGSQSATAEVASSQTLTLSTTAVTQGFLVIPVTALSSSKKITLSLTVDGKVMSCTINPGLDTGFTTFTSLTAGKNYTINLVVKGTALSVSSVSVNPWTSVPVNNTNPLNPTPVV